MLVEMTSTSFLLSSTYSERHHNHRSTWENRNSITRQETKDQAEGVNLATSHTALPLKGPSAAWQCLTDTKFLNYDWFLLLGKWRFYIQNYNQIMYNPRLNFPQVIYQRSYYHTTLLTVWIKMQSRYDGRNRTSMISAILLPSFLQSLDSLLPF